VSGAARDLDRALRRVHRGALATLGLSAAVVAAGAAAESGESGPAPPPAYWAAAVALAAVSIVGGGPARRGALSRRAVTGLVASLLSAGALGLLGVALALAEGLWRAALLYTVAGLLLAIRPPPRLSRPDDERP